jgi:RNA polymerase sigma-70 factor (ECF subfamily)
MTETATPALAGEFEAHRAFLWSLLYRLTGNAADADDLVQETFVRAMERPPARTDLPWRPWLVHVGLNLGRDLLRRRRRRGYEGPWLPSPVDTSGEQPPSYEPPAPDGSPATRYDLLESVSFAFLLALEALTPSQRAVLLLRDVFDYSVCEAAAALDMSEANVKTTHLRARRAMAVYEGGPRLPPRARQERTQQALERFLGCLAAGDVAGLEALLAADVRMLSDGGGEFVAARRPVVGRDKVLRFLFGLAQKAGPRPRVSVRVLNGVPAVIVDNPAPPPKWARRTVLLLDVDAQARVRSVYGVLATRKLTALR